MKCSICGSSGHNKRTCNFSSKAHGVPLSEIRAAAALADLLPPPNKCKAGSCPLEDFSSCVNIWKEPKDLYTKEKSRQNTCSHCGGRGHNSRTCVASHTEKVVGGRQCSLCGEYGHNKRTCVLKLPEKKQKQCGNCGEFGHNSRTCSLKCLSCNATSENEEQPRAVESPTFHRKNQHITFANGETISIDLGHVS